MKENLTLDINPRSARFREADWYKPGLKVVLGGAGGIGSYVAYYLSRQEATIYLYEFDSIEEHNLGGQLYTTDNIGEYKANAIDKICRSFSNVNVLSAGKFTETSSTNDITISAFDNMKARKLMFEDWRKRETREIFIDGRMNAEQGQIYFVTKGREEDYEKTLFEDSEIEDLPCNYKATSHCGGIIAGLMVSGLNNYIGNIESMKKEGMEYRDLPFEIHYILQLFQFNIKK